MGLGCPYAPHHHILHTERGRRENHPRHIFAVAAAEAGETVVLFDLDFQQSAMAWREARQQPKSASNPNPVPVPVPNRPIVEPYPADKLPMMSRMLKSLV